MEFFEINDLIYKEFTGILMSFARMELIERSCEAVFYFAGLFRIVDFMLFHYITFDFKRLESPDPLSFISNTDDSD